jgi:WD40 repeat protein
VASCGPNNSAMIFEYDGFKIKKTLYNETFEVIFSMIEVDGFLFTGHSKGLIMIWDYLSGERVLKDKCAIEDPITSLVYLKNQLMIWASLMNGDMVLLKINTETFTLDLMNQVKIDEPAKKIYSLTRLSDGRMCVSQDKGFTVWQINSQGDASNVVYKLVQQTAKCYLED